MTINNLVLKLDQRLGNNPRYFLVDEDSAIMVIPDEVRKCVAFICYKANDGMKLAGTAFFMHIPMEDMELSFGYLITAKHVIEGIKQKSIDQKVYVRLNMKGTGTQFIIAPTNRWLYHPEDLTVDVAVLAWVPSQDVVDYLSIPISMAATDEVIRAEGIGVGEEVFLTGLFINHYGKERNIPIVRIGNIAAMPEERVQTRDFGAIEAYLVEARSIGGLSGSPVFAHLVGVRHVGKTSKLESGKVYLLGLMHGHWDSPVTGTDELTEDTLETERVNMGIAIVVPVSKVLEVLNRKELMERRKSEEEILRKEKAPVLDTPVIDAFLTKE